MSRKAFKRHLVRIVLLTAAGKAIELLLQRAESELNSATHQPPAVSN